MIKRILGGTALIAALVASSAAAGATCAAGRIEVDPRTGTVVVELPRCDPPPTL